MEERPKLYRIFVEIIIDVCWYPQILSDFALWKQSVYTTNLYSALIERKWKGVTSATFITLSVLFV